jgi:hypothetical protein
MQGFYLPDVEQLLLLLAFLTSAFTALRIKTDE